MISAANVVHRDENSKRKMQKIFVISRPKTIADHEKSDFFRKIFVKSFGITKIIYNFAMSKLIY